MNAIGSSTSLVERYYRYHSHFYDHTRWAFLFGRRSLLDVVQSYITPGRILEIGCGTGYTLAALARRFPQAHLTGVDLSAEMLSVAERKLRHCADRVELRQQAYREPLQDSAGFDLIICSYALSMFNPGWQLGIESAAANLRPGGVFALVDFHTTESAMFRRWMRLNHVRMDGHLLPILEGTFHPLVRHVMPAYLGLWDYIHFIGRARGAPMDDQTLSVPKR